MIAPARDQDDLVRVADEVIAAAAPAARDPGDEHAAPAIEPPAPASTWLRVSMRTTANAYACRLGGPVYLVGSALTSSRPADVDIRVVLDDRDLVRLFGPPKLRDGDIRDWSTQELRQGREQLKQSRRLSRRFNCNVDFQIQTAHEFAAHEGHACLRIDTIPDEVFTAGHGDA